MFKMRTKSEGRSQSGLVSLIVVAILAVVLGLVAVGFSKLMDRELSQSLDRELSAQAFYSALAGVDDARAYLGACEPTGANCGFSTCDGWTQTALGPKYFTNDLSNGGSTAKYSCVTIDTNPSNLDYQLNADQSVTFKVAKNGMNRMYFSWQNDPKPSSFTALGSTGSLPQTTSIPSGATGLLEVNIYPVPSSLTTSCGGYSYGSDTNNTLACLSHTYYLYPNSGPCLPNNSCAATIYSYSNKGGFVKGNCVYGNTFQISNSKAAPQMCNAAIDQLISPQLPDGTTFYVRLTARYERLNVGFQTANGASSLGSIPDAQAVIDVTGQGTDVLQRIRTRIDLNNSFQTPLYGVQSMVSLCKGFDVAVKNPGQYGQSTPDLGISSYNYNGVCSNVPNTDGSITTGLPAGQAPH